MKGVDFKMSEVFNNHTFVICAYQKSDYLEACVESLLKQTVKSNIIIATSTPNDLIENISNKYDLKVYVNTGKTGIGGDWNFAVSVAKTDFVTIAHQDDIYSENYVEEIKKALEKHPNPIMLFTNHKEIRNRRSCKDESKFKNKMDDVITI